VTIKQKKIEISSYRRKIMHSALHGGPFEFNSVKLVISELW